MYGLLISMRVVSSYMFGNCTTWFSIKPLQRNSTVLSSTLFQKNCLDK